MTSPSAILFPKVNTIFSKNCSLVYAQCTLSVYSVYTQCILSVYLVYTQSTLLLSSNKLTTSNLQRI